jgi:hypothetical protein
MRHRFTGLLAVPGLLAAFALSPMSTSTAGAQAAPAVAIDTFSPRCAAVNHDVGVSVAGTTNGASVVVQLIAPSGAVLAQDQPKASSGRWSSTALSFVSSQTGTYEVRATFSTARSSAFLDVPCQAPTLEYDPPCFVVGSTSAVTMTARHFEPYAAGYMTYDVGGSEQQQRIRIPVDAHGTFTAVFKVDPADRDHPGEGTDASRTLVATATWQPCPPPGPTTTTIPSVTTAPTTTAKPTGGGTTSTTSPVVVTVPPTTPGVTLTVTPPIGPPGFVAVAQGSGFAPGPVTLTWAPGIGTVTATADTSGRFDAPMLVMPRDRIGLRQLVATSGTTSAGAAFLVVPNTVQPSGKDVAQITRIRRFLQR